MGIAGLLPLLSEAQEAAHLADFAGKTIGVDGFVWLHRAAFCCAQALALNEPTTQHLSFCRNRIELLRAHGVTPLVVFDGAALPAKAKTDAARSERRRAKRRLALEKLAQGARKQAHQLFQQCTSITPFRVWQFVEYLRGEGIEFIVAPYEADAQLAYLERVGRIHGVLTEDSDLLVFGCATVLFKLDREGECRVVRREALSRARRAGVADLSEVQFRRMCILAGCDYLPSLPGLGLKTALRLVSRNSDESLDVLISAVRALGFTVPPDYAAAFARAELAFLHQRVFDPAQKRLVHLAEPPPGVDAPEDIIGPDLPPHLALAIARAEKHPRSHAPAPATGTEVDPDGLCPKRLAAFLAAGRAPQAWRPLLDELVGPAAARSAAAPRPKAPAKPAPVVQRHVTEQAVLREWSKQRCASKTGLVSAFFAPRWTSSATPAAASTAGETVELCAKICATARAAESEPQSPVAPPSPLQSDQENDSSVPPTPQKQAVKPLLSLRTKRILQSSPSADNASGSPRSRRRGVTLGAITSRLDLSRFAFRPQS